MSGGSEHFEAALPVVPEPESEPAEASAGGGYSRAVTFWLNFMFGCARRVPWFVRWSRPFWLSLSSRFFTRPLRRGIAANAKWLLPAGASEADRHQFETEVLDHFYMFIHDIGRAASMPTERIIEQIEVTEGEEHYWAARSAGRGAILATAHLGSFEVGAAGLRAMEPRIHVVFHQDHFEAFNAIRHRLHEQLDLIEAPVEKGWRAWMQLRDALLNDEVALIQADRVMPGQKGVAVPFCGGHIDLPLGPIKLAAITGAPIVPVFAIREKSGGVRIVVEPAISASPDDLAAARADEPPRPLLQLASVLEKRILANPEQWLMLHPMWREDRQGGGEAVGSRESVGSDDEPVGLQQTASGAGEDRSSAVTGSASEDGAKEAGNAPAAAVEPRALQDSPRDASVVLTGSGLVSALGPDRETAWRRLRDGESGLRPLSALEQQPVVNKGGGEAPALPGSGAAGDPAEAEAREVAYLRRAISEALGDAGISDGLPYPAHRCGIVLGTTLHGMRSGGAYFRERSLDELRGFQAGAVLEKAAADLGLNGLASTICSACSSGLGSIAVGAMLLRTGELDMVIAGGYDPISEYAYAGFDSLGLVATGAPEPFCEDRPGMKLGEGYGVVILERAEDAVGRGVSGGWRLLGIGESADAHHLTQPDPQGRGAAKAMREALEEAGLGPEAVGLVTAHATGTPGNDCGEAEALRSVFGSALPTLPVACLKTQLGHTLGGAGAVELILSLCAMRDGVVPPTALPDPGRLEYPELQLAESATPRRIDAMLNLSMGFGGANTCVVMAPVGSSEVSSASASPSGAAEREPSRRPVARASAQPPEAEREVVVSGIGLVLPGVLGNKLFARHLQQDGAPMVRACPEPVEEELIADLLQTLRVRRMSDYVKLALAATRLAWRDAGLESDGVDGTARCAGMVGTTHGSAAYCESYYRQIVEEGIEAANPMLFAEGVPNAGAAHLSLMLQLTGACQTVIGSRTSGLEALHLAAHRIAAGRCDRAVVSTAEEATGLIRAAYEHCGLHAGGEGGAPFSPDGFVHGSGAATLVVESRAAAEARGARVYGVIETTRGAFYQADDLRSGVEQWQRMLEELGRPGQVIASANGTWLSRIEAAGIGMAGGADRPVTVSSLYGHVAETFSVTPIAAIAAVLLTGRLPRLHGEAPEGRGLVGATGEERADGVAVLATDYAGPLAAARVRPGG